MHAGTAIIAVRPPLDDSGGPVFAGGGGGVGGGAPEDRAAQLRRRLAERGALPASRVMTPIPEQREKMAARKRGACVRACVCV
jgi:hypothetical protein